MLLRTVHLLVDPLRSLKIHLITNLFAPDELAGAALFSDLALFLKDQGHDVRVTSTFSYYPAWKLRLEDRGVALREESWRGVPLRRIRMYVPKRPTGLTRMLSDLSFLGSLIRRARFGEWLPEVVVTASPMFSQCLAQRFLYRGRKVPRLIIVQDFVVDAALELGILRLPGFSGMLRWLERWSFRSAATLTTISESMRAKLIGITGLDRRVVFIPNWIHKSVDDRVRELEREPLRRQDRLLFYSGNVGVKQGLPDFVAMWPHDCGWDLHIHGGGAALDDLVCLADPQAGIRIEGVLPEQEYLRSLKRCTACLVTQKPGLGANFLPSKLLPALATGTPVLAVCEPSSPLGQEVMDGGFGTVVEPGDRAALQSVLASWSSDLNPLSELGRKALKRSAVYRRDAVIGELEKELNQLTAARSV